MRVFVAGAMIAVGALLTALCGSCTLYFGGATLWDLLTKQQYSCCMTETYLLTAIVIGGAPTVGGVFLVLEGLKWLRQRRPHPKDA